MGSKKKRDSSSSSSSDSDSGKSDSSYEKKKSKSKKSRSSSRESSPHKSKNYSKRKNESDSDNDDRKKRKSPEERRERSGHSSHVKHEDRRNHERDRHGDHRRRHDRGDRSDNRGKRDYDDRDRKDNKDDRSRDRRNDNFRERDRDRDNRGTGSRDHRDRDNRNFRDQRNERRRRRSNSFDHANANWGKKDSNSKSDSKPTEKEKPNFGLSGKLTEETNTYKGVVIKYSEPPEARKPRRRWRLYPFKGEKALQTLYIHRESGYLIGRDRKVVDIPVDHPSCSKQHAALQYRLVPFTREDGSQGKRVRPYIIDLESANGTFINNKKIEPKKYVELLEKDVIKFGFSSREYVLLHENSKDEALDDDVKQEEEEVNIKEEAA